MASSFLPRRRLLLAAAALGAPALLRAQGDRPPITVLVGFPPGGATDAIARVSAYREAAHLWDRAAEREKPGKARKEYEDHAERNRALADGDDAPTERISIKPRSPTLN